MVSQSRVVQSGRIAWFGSMWLQVQIPPTKKRLDNEVKFEIIVHVRLREKDFRWALRHRGEGVSRLQGEKLYINRNQNSKPLLNFIERNEYD